MRRIGSDTVSRSWTLALCAILVGILAASPARAQQPVTADDTGWATSLSLAPGGVSLGDPLANLTFEQGDLPVGAVGQDEHKRSYLRAGIPDGATHVEIELALSETNGTNYGTAGPILACPVTEPLSVTRGGDLDDAPDVDCSVGVEGEPDADLVEVEAATAYRFDLTPLLPEWEQSDQPGAFALIADLSEPQGLYQVTFSVELFSEIGTAETGNEDESGPIVPPVEPPEPEEEPASPDGPDPTPTPSREAPPPSPSRDTPSEIPSEEMEESAPPVTAPPAETDGQAEEEPVTQEAAMALPTPAPVRLMPWMLALALGMGALLFAGASLRSAALPPSPLDRLFEP